MMGGEGKSLLSDDTLAAKLLFLIPFAFYVAARLSLHSYLGDPLAEVHAVDYTWMACVAVMAVREVLYGRHSVRSVICLVLCVFMCYVCRMSVANEFGEALLFIYFARDMDLKPIVWVVFVELIVMFIVVVVICNLGIFHDIVFEATPTRAERHALGFYHPNLTMAYPVMAAFCWGYIRGKRYTFVDALVSLAVVCVVYRFTASRTGFIVIIFFFVLMLAWRYMPERARRRLPLTALGITAFVVFVGGIFLLIALYDPEVAWIENLDKLLVGRIKNPHRMMVRFGIKPFSQVLPTQFYGVPDPNTGEWVDANPGFIIDNGFAHLLLYAGYVCFAIVIVLWLTVFKRIGDNRDGVLFAVFVAMTLYGIAESFPFYAMYDVFIFLLATPFSVLPKRERERALDEVTADGE